MRVLLVMMALLILPYLGWAASAPCAVPCSPEKQDVQRAVDDCCRLITVACLEAKYRPRCYQPEHKCPVPLEPCDACFVIDEPCHKPLECYIPCEAGCLTEVCHKPAVAAFPVEACSDPVTDCD